MTRAAATGAVLAAAVLWGTAGAAQELAVPEASPLAVAMVRSWVGGLVLLAVALARGRDTLRSLRPHAGGVGVAAVAILVFQVGYLGGIRTAGVAVGTLVAIGSAPAWAGLLATLGGRRPTARWWAATALAVLGLVALISPAGGSVHVAGVAMAAVAGAGYAVYVTATAGFVGRVDRVALIAVIFTGCGVLLVPLPAARILGTLDGTALFGFAWLAFATIVLAYLLFTAGLRGGVDAPTATTVTLAEPLTATLLAVTLVSERLSPLMALGVVTLLAGLALAARAPATAPAALRRVP